MAMYEHKGRGYLVMANEGDARDNGEGDSEDDRSPEGLVTFKAGSRYFLAVAHEVSDTTSLYWCLEARLAFIG